ncbi:MAG: PEP-CTERM sorting domain-containing protein [Akkermansia sp.]|nr:PEP-CTERM sorting domain-containing protein [Akkermansia sp.]
MKIFSRALLAFILAATAAPLAKADLTIVSGNVYDVGKYSLSNDSALWDKNHKEYLGPNGDGSMNDSAMCWAAASANVIQYWQDTYGSFAKEGTVTGYNDDKYSSATGTGSLKVYDEILRNWTNMGGTAMNVYSWWMQGATLTGPGGRYYPSGSALLDQTTGGNYIAVFGSNRTKPVYPSLDGAPFFSAKIDDGGRQERTLPFETVQAALIEAFKQDGQAVSLDIMPVGGYSGHSITCWGYESELNAENELVITSLILSDSDDKKYGTFIVNLIKGEDGNAYIDTDRKNSDYHGNHTLKDVVYITTPLTATTSEEVAKPRSSQTAITTLDSPVTDSCQLTQSVSTSSTVIIGGGYYEGSQTTAAVAFTSSQGAHITIQNSNPGNSPQLKIGDGAMALLYGGLTINGSGSGTKGGILTDGHLYIHGGAVNVENCVSTDSGGGIYATDFDGEGIRATTYVEIKNSGNINISANTSRTQKKDAYSFYHAGGGGIAAVDSVSVRNSGDVTMTGNKAEGLNVSGGAAFVNFNTIISDSKAVTISNNTVTSSEGCTSYGGGLAGMYITVEGNESVNFTKNSANITNENGKSWREIEDGHNVYDGGAKAAGGAIAIHPYVDVSYYDAFWNPVGVPTKLILDGNGGVTFNGNSISATYTGNQPPSSYSVVEQSCYARGGAVYLGNQILSNDSVSGTEASISNNAGDIAFTSNKASGASTQLNDAEAQGGAIYISKGSRLAMDNNTGNVSFSSNSVEAKTAQGGAIYNDGQLSISGNMQVSFENNKAIDGEGDHIYNAKGAVAEITNNQNVSFVSEKQSTVSNKGDLYLSSAKDCSISFHNTSLETKENGVSYLGTDVNGNLGSSTLLFSNSSLANMSMQAKAATAELKNLKVSATEIMGEEKNKTTIQGLDIESTAVLQIQMLTMKSDVGVSANSTTMHQVVIDLTGKDYYEVSMDNGTCYVYDITDMMQGALTLNNVTFKAADSKGDLGDYISKGNAIAFNFGSDTNIQGAEAVTLDIGSLESRYLTSMNGAVYFAGENVTPPDINVPEPATGILALTALAGLAGRRRRK